MIDLYFANKIIVIKEFTSYVKKHSQQLGCNICNYYYLDNRIFTFKFKDGKYYDLNDFGYPEINIQKLDKFNKLFCEDCEFYSDKIYEDKCERTPKSRLLSVGLANMKTLTSFLRSCDTEKALEIVDQYNSEIGEYYTLIDIKNKLYNENIDKVNTKVKRYLKK